jgi:hypothetical protein
MGDGNGTVRPRTKSCALSEAVSWDCTRTAASTNLDPVGRGRSQGRPAGQHANSTVPVGKSESTVPKTAMLSRSPTAGTLSPVLSAPRDPRPTVNAPDRTVIASLNAAQPDAASGNGVKPATQASSLSRPGTTEREAVLQPVPETRPITIEGWIVRDVRGEAIVLQGPNGIRSVMRGDVVPGVGRIDSVVRWGSRWIVSTTSGLIATP